MMRTLFGCCFFCLLMLTVTPSRGRLPGLGQSLLAAPPVFKQQPEIVASRVAGQPVSSTRQQARPLDFKQGPKPKWIWTKSGWCGRYFSVCAFVSGRGQGGLVDGHV